MGIGRAPVRAALAMALLLTATGGLTAAASEDAEGSMAATPSMGSVVPAPVSITPSNGAPYMLLATTKIYVAPGAEAVGEYLANIWRRSSGFPLPVLAAPAGGPQDGISLLLSGADAGLGPEGYRLDSSSVGVVVRANQQAGLFAGVQTLRQLVPATAEGTTPQPGPWPVAVGTIVDHPRFAYRGVMLDVARHFFPVETVERYLDQLALYKINYLHLHLTDDQGWRLMIDSWPRLATHGGSTQVGGGRGGYYTKAQYAQIVAYAAARHITVVPEIDMPGHVNAALASYAQLNCNGTAPPLYTGIGVGFSSLCATKEITYTFVDNVIGELAAITPGSYIHIGGDEAAATKPADYATFMNRAQAIVAAHGKTVLAWHQVVDAAPAPSTVAQYWDLTRDAPDVAAAAAGGTKLLLSPANHAYLDMKYTADTKLGQAWAGLVEVRDAYDWDPGSYLSGVPASAVLGVEAALWTETITTLDDIDYMTFPRLVAIAELGWSPAVSHDWAAFRQRLAAQGPRWTAQGMTYYRSPQVPWPS